MKVSDLKLFKDGHLYFAHNKELPVGHTVVSSDEFHRVGVSEAPLEVLPYCFLSTPYDAASLKLALAGEQSNSKVDNFLVLYSYKGLNKYNEVGFLYRVVVDGEITNDSETERLFSFHVKGSIRIKERIKVTRKEVSKDDFYFDDQLLAEAIKTHDRENGQQNQD